MCLGIDIIHDLPVSGCNDIILFLITTAKCLIGRTKLQMKGRLERRAIIKALRVPQKNPRLVQQAKGQTEEKIEGNPAAFALVQATINFLQWRFPEVRSIRDVTT